ncbi:YozE family protein [Pontibacillus sp. HMF3514]|uniref:YozE family protein n=1 Tax=Pontibacillus sp. HMF3514 TaxID=2692425 RepID=UPI0013200757|nr:YozE family protein [Pontibacillus sp. HMF3514]QHE52451.1 YozE family protein [Pontibacillus sp. HMF3514]
MRTFYHFVMTYRGKVNPDDESKLADWMYKDHSFPKQSRSYEEISRYLEWNTPFASALQVFDRLWEKYEAEYE